MSTRNNLTDLKFRVKALLTARAMETEKTTMKTMAKDDKNMKKDNNDLKMAGMDNG